MWKDRNRNFRRTCIFFRICLSHNSLEAYYLQNFAMIQHHNWSLTEIEDMLPYERILYSELLMQWVNEENARIEEQNRKNKI